MSSECETNRSYRNVVKATAGLLISDPAGTAVDGGKKTHHCVFTLFPLLFHLQNVS